MAQFPGSVPDFSGEIGGDTDALSSPSLPAWATHISEEVVALATELGINPSAGASSVADRLDGLAKLPPSAGAVQFVSTAGDDGNDGRSPGSAKATIAAAITALPAGGGVVQCGIGDFAGGFTTGAKQVTIRGVGQELTWITGTGITIVTLAAPGSRLEDLGVRDATGHADTIGVLVDNGAAGVDRWALNRVFVWGTGKLGVGVSTVFALKGTVADSEIIAWDTGVYLDRQGTGSNQSNANTFTAVKVRGNTTGFHAPADGSINTCWTGCTLEANEVGAQIDFGFHSFYGCHFENGVGATPTNWKGTGYVRTVNCFFQDATYDIWVTGGSSRHLSIGDFLAAGIRHDGTGVFRVLTPALGSLTTSGTGSASIAVTDPP